MNSNPNNNNTTPTERALNFLRAPMIQSYGSLATGELVVLDNNNQARANAIQFLSSLPPPPFHRRMEIGWVCVICREEEEMGALLSLHPCEKHWFHTGCLNRAMTIDHRCPLCRKCCEPDCDINHNL